MATLRSAAWAETAAMPQAARIAKGATAHVFFAIPSLVVREFRRMYQLVVAF